MLPTISRPLASADDIAELLRRWVGEAGVAEGARLPTERALAEALGVNRNLIRSALRKLDRQGMIHRHVGRGTFLGPAPAAPTRVVGRRAPGGEASPLHLLQARAALEPRLAALAALAATSADLDRLEQAVAALAVADTLAGAERASIRFVGHLAQATRNPVLAAMAGELSRAREAALARLDLRRPCPPDAAARRAAVKRALIAAIRDSDPDGARAAAEDMLAELCARLPAALMGSAERS